MSEQIVDAEVVEGGRTPIKGLVFDRHGGRWRIETRDRKRVYFYRAVMEAHLGRELEPTEQVHHLNGDSSDDRIENLELIDPSAHGALHARQSWDDRKANWEYPWSEHFAVCLICWKTDRPHVGNGLCSRCSSRVRNRARRLRKKVFGDI